MPADTMSPTTLGLGENNPFAVINSPTNSDNAPPAPRRSRTQRFLTSISKNGSNSVSPTEMKHRLTSSNGMKNTVSAERTPDHKSGFDWMSKPKMFFVGTPINSKPADGAAPHNNDELAANVRKALAKRKFYENGAVANGLVTDGPCAETASTVSLEDHKERETDLEALIKETEKLKEAEKVDTYGIVFAFVFNFVAAIGIVWSNKWVVVSGFKWMTVLTWTHFCATLFTLESGARFGFFDKKASPSILLMMPICIAFAGYVVFGNLSLKYNTVSIYQLLKVATTPVLCMMQWAMYDMSLTVWQWLSLVPVCLGVGIATVNSFEVSGTWGLIFGGITIVVTAMYTIWIKTQQSALNMSPAQLLHNQALYSVALLVPVALATDGELISCFVLHRPTYFPDHTSDPAKESSSCDASLGPLTHKWTVIFALMLSSMFAVGVNLSTFMVVGKTSPATFAVVSQGKLVCILLSGFLLFGDVVSGPAIFGCGLAVLGVCCYSYCKANNF